MRNWNSLNSSSLSAQIRSQRQHQWNIDKDIDWKRGIDPGKYLLPLDRDAVLFPGANAEQRLALSQLMGLIINSTIGEMEEAILKLRDVAWESLVREYPVNPEMVELGDLFFQEEAKHSATFARYIDRFCETTSVPRDALDLLLPKGFGSNFLRATSDNARRGGFVFWWVVGAVEEVSVEIYRHLREHQTGIDPLYYAIHRRHLEEEARHRSYAFLMLDLIHRRPRRLISKIWQKTDAMKAQLLMTSWILAELSKVLEVGRLRDRHPFFETLSSCLPLFHAMSWRECLEKLFVTAPFLSLVLNPRHHRLAQKAAVTYRIWTFPYPRPRTVPLSVDKPRRLKVAA